MRVLPEPAPLLAKVQYLLIIAMTSIEYGNGILPLCAFEKFDLIFPWGCNLAGLTFPH